MAENKNVERKNKFSLIELLMIIMVVGIVFTLTIPLRNDRIIKGKLKEAVKNIQIIARADVAFKEDPANGYYIFEHNVLKIQEDGSVGGDDLLNVQDELETTDGIFLFDYAVTDSSVVAITNQNFGKEGAKIFYYLPNGPWNVGDDKISKNVFDPNWLP
ncbi:MAG: hypothetical protein K9N09_00365 [Candidatus Cloacimonetes bacterium]|nr:hypothetical protein [Candidatus Cloacimonadota bacterium]MCF7812914.1 hypothetical protein [Candidatus Cloacimonadota bacterium]MCF7867126.1 hypothetical protein [Candidatus Cloacimonadota bacterium]MCF7882554.1 hypothetical protein [Candidatus Cloacimonadota bacterium]